MTERCPIRVWTRFTSYICNKPVKRNGRCGTHANAAEKAAQRFIESEERYQREKERRDHARELSDVLTSLGVKSSSTWGGEVVLLEPEKLIHELKGEL